MKLDISKYKAFFFDFDGVIVDSLDIKTQAFGDLFKKYGKEIAEEVMKHHRNNGGVSRYEKFRHYYKYLLNKPINKVIVNRLDKEYSALVVKKVINAPYVKGVENFLKKLNQKKKLCFVISATPQKEIRQIVRKRKLQCFFKDVVGSPKDKANNLRGLLRKYRIKPAEAVYFGDAKSDYEAAKASKIVFIVIVQDKGSELQGLSSIPKLKDFNPLKSQFRKLHDTF